MKYGEDFKTSVLVVFCILAFIHPVFASKVIYVDDDAAIAGNGSSWSNAYKYLQDALADADSAEKPVEIRVAQGIYKPDRTSTDPNGTADRYASFKLHNNVSLKGGYAGSLATDPNERNIDAYKTILSGDLTGDDGCGASWEKLDNSYHIVSAIESVNFDIEINRNIILEGFTISGGYANKEFTSSNSTGGAIYIVGKDPIIKDCWIVDNYAKKLGGGIYCELGDIMLDNCKFKNNNSRDGGALAITCEIWFKQIFCDLQNCKFENNQAERFGGATFADIQCKLTFHSCTFNSNSASEGGAMYNQHYNGSPTLELTACSFTSNKAEKYGAAIRNYSGMQYSSMSLFDCLFIKNIAQRTAAIDSQDCPIEMNNCTFIANHGDHSGAIFIACENPILKDCRFFGNSAGEDAYGGVANISGTNPQITNSIFAGNKSHYGGALYLHGEEATISNCIFTGNFANTLSYPQYSIPGEGGALHIIQSNLNIDNCTFFANRGEHGNAISCDTHYTNHLRITNSIIQDGGNEIWHNEDTTLKIQYSNINSDELEDGNIDADPCFVDPGYWDPNRTPDNANDDFWVDGDYHLKSQAGRWDPNNQTWIQDNVTSPCIDAGDPSSPIGLEPFPNGARINMGAFGGTSEASKSYFGTPVCENIIAGDLNGDCIVDSKDFAILASHWLEIY